MMTALVPKWEAVLKLITKTRCNACGSSHFEEIHNEPLGYIAGLGGVNYPNRIVICRDCGLVFTNPLPDQESILTYYRELSNHEAYGHSPGNIDNIYRTITARFPAGFSGNLLEIGCANGEKLEPFKAAGWRITGIEPNPRCAELARTRYGLELITSPWVPGMLDDQFDLIIMSDVIEHFVHPEITVASLPELLNPAGLVYIVTPNILKPIVDMGYYTFEHFTYFSSASLARLMARSGFAIDFLTTENSTKITSTWKLDPTPPLPANDYEPVRQAVLAYRHQQTTRLAALEARINAAVQAVPAKDLAVWGAGIHSSQMLAMTGLGRIRPKCFMDNDPKKWGADLNGIPIIQPPPIHGGAFPAKGVLISSRQFENEIADQLAPLKKRGIQIFKLYD